MFRVGEGGGGGIAGALQVGAGAGTEPRAWLGTVGHFSTLGGPCRAAVVMTVPESLKVWGVLSGFSLYHY